MKHQFELGRKQKTTHAQFKAVWEVAHQLISRRTIDALVDATAFEIKAVVGKLKPAYGWSGGKDSLALQVVCEKIGIVDGVFGMTNLEYPAFLQWVTDNMPQRITVKNTGLDLQWLSENPRMLFPQDANTAGLWFKKVQHTAQRDYFKENNLGVLLIGRRHKDGNFTGENGIYTDGAGVTRYSPLRDWTHEEVFALLRHYSIGLPPTYSWPRGFRVGTGPWPARQWTQSVHHGWSEVWAIDKGIVHRAAAKLESAKKFLSCVE